MTGAHFYHLRDAEAPLHFWFCCFLLENKVGIPEVEIQGISGIPEVGIPGFQQPTRCQHAALPACSRLCHNDADQFLLLAAWFSVSDIKQYFASRKRLCTGQGDQGLAGNPMGFSSRSRGQGASPRPFCTKPTRHLFGCGVSARLSE